MGMWKDMLCVCGWRKEVLYVMCDCVQSVCVNSNVGGMLLVPVCGLFL